MSWQLLSATIKYQNRYMTVTEDKVITDHGDELVYGVVHKNPAVMIIPWDGEKFTLIGQYRYPVDTFSWEFPAGHMEHLNLEAAAIAELEEETGLKSSKIQEIGYFNIAPGHHTQVCKVYLATGLSQGEQHLEVAEKGMQIKTIDHAEINNLILNHQITDGLTISSLKIFEIYQANQ